jgi:hypothetical protein
MDNKKNIFVCKIGEKKPLKISIKVLINRLNSELYTQKLFINEKEAIKFIEKNKRLK